VPRPEPLPEVFRVRFAYLEEQFLTKEPGDLFAQCFGCGPENLIGLRMRCFKTDEGVLSPILVPRRYVPLETPILGRGRLTARHDRYVDVQGSLEELATSRVLARARGRFF